jgi:hypothetical protein
MVAPGIVNMKMTISIITALLLFSACGGEKPVSPDGGGAIALLLVDTTGTLPGSIPGEPSFLEGAKVSIQARTHEYVDVGESDDSGTAGFEGLAAGDYTVFARREIVAGAQKKVFTGFSDMHVEGDAEAADTLYLSTVTVNALMINEIYYCGSDYARFYFYDQYVELYNSSVDTLYLDGCIITRNSSLNPTDIEELDYVRAIYGYQFPGVPITGRQYPIYPGQFVVIAADAIDHSVYANNGADLSHADWECFNPLGSDYDVPGVPNIISIHPTSRVDYMISLAHDAVVLTTGEEYWITEIDGAIRIALPLYTVIDGVEYATSSDKTKYLTMRVDAGFAGLGCAKYSGESTERRELGLDVNNSTFDFILLTRPTIGYSHVQ